MIDNRKQIVILGGGFGGVYTARCLERILRPNEADICLINRENYWVYQPMLPEVISGSIGLTDVVSPIRRLCPRTNLVMREVEDRLTAAIDRLGTRLDRFTEAAMHKN